MKFFISAKLRAGCNEIESNFECEQNVSRHEKSLKKKVKIKTQIEIVIEKVVYMVLNMLKDSC